MLPILRQRNAWNWAETGRCFRSRSAYASFMRRANVLLAIAATVSSSASMACSCAYPETLSAKQIRSGMKGLSVVGYGSVSAIQYPAGCKIAPLRWINVAFGRRVPVVHKLRFQKILWGRSAQTVDVVQYQMATWSSCKPLGGPACEPKLPWGDALWPLRRLPHGENRYAGRCEIMLAMYALHLQPETGMVNVR
jgi:hypothetical protein